MINGKTVVEPRLTDLLKSAKAETQSELNCVKVGAIESFNPTRRTVIVQISFKRVLNDGTIVSYPILVDCPVVTLAGGVTAMSFPIAAGDECLVLFGDANIDAWFSGGGQAAPNDGRIHDLSDGFALVGVNSLAQPLAIAVSSTEAGFGDTVAKVVVKNGLISIANQAQNLNTILQALMAALGTMTTASVAAGTTQTAIAALASELSALLY